MNCESASKLFPVTAPFSVVALWFFTNATPIATDTEEGVSE